MNTASKKYNLLVIIGIMAFFTVVMFCAPYTSDDMLWGMYSDKPFDVILEYVLTNGNGRVLGNLFTIWIVPKTAFSILLKAGILTAICLMMADLFCEGKPFGLPAAFLLMIGMSPALFSEVITWTSGYANYINPVFCTLLCLCLLKRAVGREDTGLFLPTILLFFIGFAGQFFVEHVSICNVVIASILLLYSKKTRNQRAALLSLAWLIGAVIGLVLMSLVPHIFYIPGNHQELYGRAIRAESLMQLVDTCWRNALGIGSLIFQNAGLYCVLSILIVLLLQQSPLKQTHPKRVCYLSYYCIVFACAAAANMFLCGNMWEGPFTAERLLTILFLLFGFVGVFIYAIFTIQDLRLRNRALFSAGIAVFSLAPLLIVAPIVNRCMLFAYMALLCAGLTCLQYILRNRGEAWMHQFAGRVAVAGFSVACAIGALFFNIRNWEKEREAHIKAEMDAGAVYIEIARTTYPYVYENRTPWSHKYWYYYDEPGDIEFHFSKTGGDLI